MNPEAQRIAIAEACGWTRLPSPHGPGVLGRWTNPSNSYTQNFVAFYDKDGFGSHGGMFPDYLNDLNAMHEAEKVLNDLPEYCTNLAAVVYHPLTNSHESNQLWQGWWFVHATAAQRAEAFLRCLGKWTEKP